MYFTPLCGSRSNLDDQPKQAGKLYVCSDTKEIFMDTTDNTRIQITSNQMATMTIWPEEGYYVFLPPYDENKVNILVLADEADATKAEARNLYIEGSTIHADAGEQFDIIVITLAI